MSLEGILSEVRHEHAVSDARRAGEADLRKATIADAMKLVGNSGYGKTITSQLKHRNMEYCSDAEASRKVNTPG
ncbi:unnamed protein product, partial [Porites lobata]